MHGPLTQKNRGFMIKHLAINKFCKTLLQESEADLEERKRY